jgi:hypothetical protein
VQLLGEPVDVKAHVVLVGFGRMPHVNGVILWILTRFAERHMIVGRMPRILRVAGRRSDGRAPERCG